MSSEKEERGLEMSYVGSNADNKDSVRRNVLIKGKGGSKEGGRDKQLPTAKDDTVPMKLMVKEQVRLFNLVLIYCSISA